MDVRKETMEKDMPKLVSALRPRFSSCASRTPDRQKRAERKCSAAAHAVRRVRRCLANVLLRRLARQAHRVPVSARRC